MHSMIAVEQKHLYPSAPPLTRYEETVLPMLKKKLLEFTVLDKSVSEKLNELTIPKLCIRLNTLQVSMSVQLLMLFNHIIVVD